MNYEKKLEKFWKEMVSEGSIIGLEMPDYFDQWSTNWKALKRNSKKVIILEFPGIIEQKFGKKSSKNLEIKYFKRKRIFSDSEEKSVLEITLLNDKLDEPFNYFISSLVQETSLYSDSRSIFIRSRELIDEWLVLFRRATKGLSEPMQAGLYGELTILKDIIIPIFGIDNSIKFWTGPLHKAKDFESHKWAIEVKTTTRKDYPFARISSEYQLDFEEFNTLFFYSIYLNSEGSDGETLNEIVKKINTKISDNEVKDLFQKRLLLAGYEEKNNYDKIHYDEIKLNGYLVNESFPKIIPSGLDNGINRVSYTLNINSIENLISSNEVIQNQIKSNEQA